MATRSRTATSKATRTRPKKTARRSLRDRLSRLSYLQACKLLGENGKKLIRQGGQYDTIDIERDVYLRGDLFRLTLRAAAEDLSDIRVTMTLMAARNHRLTWNCDHCETTCEHIGAAFSLILEDKYALGLSDIPKEGVPLELLDENELVLRAVAERALRAREEKFRLRSDDPKRPWTDYLITSGTSGKTYRVALRGDEPGQSFCTCPDFRTNTLGTCKHILYTLSRVKHRFSEGTRGRPYVPSHFAVYLRYGEEVSLHLQAPQKISAVARRLVKPLLSKKIDNLPVLLKVIGRLEQLNESVTIYPDAEEWIERELFLRKIRQLVSEIRRDPAEHTLRTDLLKVPLLPYQMDGVAFAVGAGRAILADDMGLGKTIQGIGVAELFARIAGITRVLIVCPASLKSQWRDEIHRFSERDCQIVLGTAQERYDQYDNDRFFTICNYEQVLRDAEGIERVPWDLIILDEGQRIKNWEAKTSRVIKALRSPWALVLSGTPLENRLDELYSVIQFVDDRRLPPAFRFFHQHRVVEESGRVTAYKNLDVLRERLKPILLRRTRRSVLNELPERTTEIVRIPPTDDQQTLSLHHMSVAARIASKRFLTEMDILRIQKALLMARMAADSTFLVNKQEPSYSSKLEHLNWFLEQLFEEPDRKAVVFSEWTTMLDLIEPILARLKLDFVRLDGSVPQKKRQQLVHRFQEDPTCRLFLTTNAGSTGLNLQAANTVINVDLPWNPAVLEQRIARAHRMGQKRPVSVYLLVTEDTFEERLLTTLADKQSLAIAALDADSDVSTVDFSSGIEEMKRRLEVLLGEQPPAPVDASQRLRVKKEQRQIEQRRQRVAAVGGELLGAVFHFLGELVSEDQSPPAPESTVTQIRQRLGECVDQDEQGQQRLTVTLPDQNALDGLAQTLAQLLVSGKDPQ